MSDVDIALAEQAQTEMQCVPFRRALRCGGDALALADPDGGITRSYAQLQRSVEAVADCLGRGARCLVLLFANNDVPSIECYLASLEAGHAVFISPIAMTHPGAVALIRSYRPEIVLWKAGALAEVIAADYGPPAELGTYRMARRLVIRDGIPDVSVGVVLSTSGSSGSSKAVRLPATGLAESATAVAEALAMDGGARVLAGLPFGYVYGLSVLNSTLCCGGALVLVSGSPADKDFWRRAAGADITMIPAVSQTLEFMKRHGVDTTLIPTLQKLIHSGDSLDPRLFYWAYERLSQSGVSVYLMYGQTEAGGRMTVLQPSHLPGMYRSVGKPLRSCEIRIDSSGEILFRGPGVMLGYARGRDDLAVAERAEGFLHTGDLGTLDECGFLHITGRLSRDRKIFGKRINLDEVETFARRGAQVSAVETGGVISVFFEAAALPDAPSVLQLSRHFQVPPQSFRVFAIPRLPCTARGKIAYQRLTELASALPVRSDPLD